MRHPRIRLFVLFLAAVVLLVAAAVSIRYGAAEITLGQIYEALAGSANSHEHRIIRTIRVPRALIGATVGASLGIAGALMQALTRNPLAAPGVLGVNAGASLAAVGGAFFLGGASLSTYASLAFVGAALAGAVVYLLGSVGRGGMTPLKLTVAGAAMTAVLTSFTQGLLILNERSLEEMRFWLAGSVAGRDLGLFMQVLPLLAVGLIGALLLAGQVSTLSLGEDVARGLGQNTARLKVMLAVIIILLAGGSVAIAGPIGFIGLAVPHIARGLVGQDYRWVLPCTALLGGALLITADVISRFVISPEELAVGITTAILGAPFFIYQARKGVKRA